MHMRTYAYDDAYAYIHMHSIVCAYMHRRNVIDLYMSCICMRKNVICVHLVNVDVDSGLDVAT